MRKLLLTAGISAFAQRVAKLFPNDQLVFADSYPIPSPLLQSENYLVIPSPSKLSFVHELLKLCLDHHITQIIPLRESELEILAQSKLLFEEYGITILLPCMEDLPKIAKLVNPTQHNCPRILVKNVEDAHPQHPDVPVLLGIYAFEHGGLLQLCCVV